MPRCDGRPDGQCPLKVNNSSVKLSQGDLMLCRDCDEYRFPSVKVKSAKSLPSAENQSAPVLRSTSGDTGHPPTSYLSSCSPPSTLSSLSASVQTCSMTKLVINELLFFVLNKYDTHTRADIHSAVLCFYREDEIMGAKQLLIHYTDESQRTALQPFTRKRIGDSKLDRSVDDILSIISLIDENDCRDTLPTFCAASMARIPTLEDEMSDLAAVRNELSDLKQKVDAILNNMTCQVTSGFTAATKADKLLATSNQSDERVILRPTDDNRSQQSREIVCISEEQLTAAEVLEAGSARCSTATYSQVAAQPPEEPRADNSTSDADFHTVTRKTKMNKKGPIFGSAADDKGFRGVAKKFVICASRMSSDVSTQKVTEYLKSAGINVFSCYTVVPKNKVHVENKNDCESENTLTNESNQQNEEADEPRFVSMRICIASYDAKKVFDEHLWPKGIIVRPWVFKKKD